ncbi:glycosyltransferase [Paraperlucidibaca wandonensis]|uniref:Glycosyltransferase n=1 Tax=Paraperlucidibaca wandonensis TaxID=1268273 RepID=A0ABW3HI83_9GAMM
MHKVSIIIPNFNYGQYVSEAIESALNQTYPNIEVIFIDDGSVDGSLDAALSYSITVLSQENQGVSAARNNAASMATGDYLLFLDSDDLLYPDAIEVMVKELASSEANIGFCYGQLQYFGEKNDIFISAPFDPKKLSFANYIQTSVLIKKSIFDAVGGFDRGFALREDWELFIRVWHYGYSGKYLPRPVIKYRKHRPKKVVREMSKLRKRLSDVKLIRLYPMFFWRKVLSSPVRFLYYNFRYFKPSMVGNYGKSKMEIKLIK